MYIFFPNIVLASYESVNQDYSLEFLTKVDVKNGMPLKNTHYAVIINEECIVNSDFLFWNNDQTEQITIDAEKIAVSALEYCEQIRGLFVGFNIGLWQIWSLERLSILYTSYMSSVICPVSHFAFMVSVLTQKISAKSHDLIVIKNRIFFRNQ